MPNTHTAHRRFVFMALSSFVLTGCFAEFSGGYYPIVSGGSRVEKSGYSFGFHLGLALKVRKIRASLGQGGEVVAADYEDPTGPGSVGHLAGFNTARLDWMMKRLGEPSYNGDEVWLDLTVGSSFGKGYAAVEYDESVMVSKDKRNIGHFGSTWSAYAGPSIHASQGQEGDILLTVAPAIHNSTMDAHDPFRAYGATVRLVIALGVDPPSVDWGDIGIVKLMRSGGSAGGSGLDDDLGRHNRNMDKYDKRRKDERDRKRREK